MGWKYNGCKDIRTFYKKLPRTTIVRAIHLHCYGGMALSGPDSKVPFNNSKKLLSYIEEKFPDNVCGLSLSDNDEVGQYRGWSQSKWGKDLSARPISLAKLKSSLESDPDLYPTVMLTSDYLLRDLKNSFCENYKHSQVSSNDKANTAGSVCFECLTTKPIAPSQDIMNLKSMICKTSDEDSKILENFNKANTLFEEFSYVEAEVSREYMKEKFQNSC